MSTPSASGIRRRRGGAKAAGTGGAGAETRSERDARAHADTEGSSDSGGSGASPPPYETSDDDSIGSGADAGAGSLHGADTAAGGASSGRAPRATSGDNGSNDASDGSEGDSDGGAGERQPGSTTVEEMARDVLAARALEAKASDDGGLVDVVMGGVGFLFAFAIGVALPVLTSVDHTVLMTGGLCTLLAVVLVANFLPTKKPQQTAANQARAGQGDDGDPGSHTMAMQVFTGAAGVGLMLGGLIGNVVSHVYHPRLQVWEVDSL